MTKGKLYESIVVYEDDGLINEVHSILTIIEEAKKEFPQSMEPEDYWNWFRKWLGDEE